MSYRESYNTVSPWDRPDPSRDSFASLGSPSTHRGSSTFGPPATRASLPEQHGPASSSGFLPPQPPYLSNAPSAFVSSIDHRDSRSAPWPSNAFSAPDYSSVQVLEMNRPLHMHGPSDSSRSQYSMPTASMEKLPLDYESRKRSSPDSYSLEGDEYSDGQTSRSYGGSRPGSKSHAQRRPANRDEFDGPHQFLDKPSQETIAAQEKELPHLSTNLFVNEQDDILSQVNECLSKCAFDFVAKYQFPIPLESDKRPVRTPVDREWTEWVYLLKRLATKRRIPARVLYNGQIKQLVTVLENSLEMRHAAKHQSRPLKDDRNVLQLISAGLQVAKILKDASAMGFLDRVYAQTEKLIHTRRLTPGYM